MAVVMAFSFSLSHVARADEIKYIYYPANEVYFNPVQKEYYYMDNGTWVERTVAPNGVTLTKGVNITLEGQTPYVYHTTVIKKYPKTYIIQE